jgi:hypothetical protein
MEIESKSGTDSVCPSKISRLFALNSTVSFCGGIISGRMEEMIKFLPEDQRLAALTALMQEQREQREWERERLLLQIQLQTLGHIQGPQSAGCALDFSLSSHLF